MAIFKGAGVAAAALMITALTAGPSHAQGYSHTDPTGDMFHYTDTYNTQTGKDTQLGPTQAPAQTDGDITSLTAQHRARRVNVTVHMVDFRSVGNSAPASNVAVALIRMKTGAGLERDVLMGLDGNRRFWEMVRGRDWQPVRCRFTHSYDSTTHTVHVSVPRSCLRRPKVVRVGALAGTQTHTDTGKLVTTDGYADDALRNGAASFDRPPAMSPWLKRG